MGYFHTLQQLRPIFMGVFAGIDATLIAAQVPGHHPSTPVRWFRLTLPVHGGCRSIPHRLHLTELPFDRDQVLQAAIFQLVRLGLLPHHEPPGRNIAIPYTQPKTQEPQREIEGKDGEDSYLNECIPIALATSLRVPRPTLPGHHRQ